LDFHGIKNLGLKFSGRKGWHIGIPFSAFPKKIQNIQIKDFFPEGPRIIASYLKEMIKKGLAERILEISSIKEISRSTGKPIQELVKNNEFDPYSVLEIDTVLISSRHLYRMAYSLHEISGLSSIVIRPEQLRAFHIGWAKPDRVVPKQFLPDTEEQEASELFIQALDWAARQEHKKPVIKKFNEVKPLRIEIKKEVFPPCIIKILDGIKQDGRKRALFILINFFRSLGTNFEKISELLKEWNKKNYVPLKESYIKTQLNWFKKQQVRLPPNCKQYYQDLAVCEPDFLCGKIKNPISYVPKKARLMCNEKRKSKKI
ncbi:MAG: hypothetical protein QXP53_01215, partial [Candidatus Pacearchaeota archaeon]